MKPFFSIIIPTLNEEKCLPILLKAISLQTEKSYEIIIVDGKSTDQTINVAKQFINKFNKINITFSIISSLVGNVAHQRNKGAEIAKGIYLVFFDADIVIPRNYLKSIKNTVQKTKQRFIGTFIKAETDLWQDRAITILLNLVIEIGNDIGKPILPGYDIIMKKTLFEHLGKFREDIKIGEDQELTERAFVHGYPPYILEHPTIIHSSRRFRKEGYTLALYKYLLATLHVIFKGPITDNIIDYPMGGNAHKQ
jgi:glycosyltransferase involved in cell wall biosynthesis